MMEVRIHGRGGQGSFLAAWLLAQAGLHRGMVVHACPEMAVERHGAPATAWVRMDDRRVSLLGPVTRPTHVVVMDPGLLTLVPVTAGLEPGATVLVNSPSPPGLDLLDGPWRLAWVDASRIAAQQGLGGAWTPQPAAPLLGAFVAVTGLVPERDLRAIVSAAFPGDEDRHRRAVEEGFLEARLVCVPLIRREDA